MGIRHYKPTSPGRRNATVSDFSELTDKNKKPEKSLTEPLKKTGGRNNQGFITARHRGGGHKRMYRVIDFRRNDHDGIPAKVTHIEYDPNRSARIALIVYPDGVKKYIIAPEGLKAGMSVTSGPNAEPKLGNCLPMGKHVVLGKAGRSRWLGRRPHVRGVAMNPVDHPMGGGEGRTSGGRNPCSPTGKLAKGGKTRRRRKPSNSAIIRRRKSVRYGQLKL